MRIWRPRMRSWAYRFYRSVENGSVDTVVTIGVVAAVLGVALYLKGYSDGLLEQPKPPTCKEQQTWKKT